MRFYGHKITIIVLNTSTNGKKNHTFPMRFFAFSCTFPMLNKPYNDIFPRFESIIGWLQLLSRAMHEKSNKSNPIAYSPQPIAYSP